MSIANESRSHTGFLTPAAGDREPPTVSRAVVNEARTQDRWLALRSGSISALCFSFILCLCGVQTEAASARTLFLTHNWQLQSSAKIQTGGADLSTAAFNPAGWYPATVPSTVVGTLVEDGVYKRPFFGMNLRSLPGMDYAIGSNFSNEPMPTNSPFRVSWWYRKEFKINPPSNGRVWLHFAGINDSANVWLNGQLIADTNRIVGAYRTYEFDITEAVRAGKPNALAVQIFPPRPDSLAITWVDWNPMPPDKNMGLWREVSVTTTGPVALRDPQVVTKLDLPSLAEAHLTVSAKLVNAGDHAIRTVLRCRIGKIEFHQTVELGAKETRQIIFKPNQFTQLNIHRPRLWWPNDVGPQNLYALHMSLKAAGKISDHAVVHFGIREVSSEFNDNGYRVFKINGRPILIRGGGWATDMFMRSSRARQREEVRYVKDMHLNAIRFEGKIGDDHLLNLCDRQGILVLAGWCCCGYWEQAHWGHWKDKDYPIAADSLRDQLLRIRNHPCILTWLYGSDNPPDARAERNYLNVLKEVNWPNCYLSSASAHQSPLDKTTGVKMTGPYDYVPPVYWYVNTNAGGAFGFNTETSPGPAVPPLASLRRMLPPDHLWPIDKFWRYHAGGGPFRSLGLFTEALDHRYGEATNVADYAEKSQLITYEGERAMFEAYRRNKFNSTGVIHWMMQNAWPSMIWHLYDYYLRPAGGYFGVKKACEPLHIQYSYDDNSVVVVNGYYRSFRGLKATASIYDLDLAKRASQQVTVNVAPNSSQRVLTLPEPDGLTSTYFVRLTLSNAKGKCVSSNFYWLSTQPDVMGQPRKNSSWYYTPTRQFANFTALETLSNVSVHVSATSTRKQRKRRIHVTIENPTQSLAFFVHLKVKRSQDGKEILPVIWQDNYFPLMPGEKRDLTASYAAGTRLGKQPVVVVSGWNVLPQTVSVR